MTLLVDSPDADLLDIPCGSVIETEPTNEELSRVICPLDPRPSKTAWIEENPLMAIPTVTNSWDDDDDETDDESVDDDVAPEEDEPDPFDDFDEDDFDDDFDDDFEEELDDEYEIEPKDDGLVIDSDEEDPDLLDDNLDEV